MKCVLNIFIMSFVEIRRIMIWLTNDDEACVRWVGKIWINICRFKGMVKY